MQVTVETTHGLERKVTIAVPSESLESRFAERVRNTAGEVKLPGFRPGKVPLKEIERRFGAKLREEVASELLQSSFADAVRQEGLSPAGQASIEIIDLKPGNDLKYAATFEVMPQFELADLGQLKLRQPEAQINEADIDATVQSLRQRKTEWVPVERPVATGDRVAVDYAIRLDGEVIESDEGTTFTVDENNENSALDNAIIGLSANETRAFPVPIRHPAPRAEHESAPAQAASEASSAGVDGVDGTQEVEDSPGAASDDQPLTRQGVGEVTLKSVEEPHLPEIDDAFLDDFGIEQGEDRLARFRAEVRDRMQVELEAATRNAIKREVIKALVEAHDFELPEALVTAEIEAEKQRLERYLQDSLPTDISDAYRDIAERDVRARLVLGEIVTQESIQVDDERIRARIEEMASGYEEAAEVRKWIYGDEEQLRRVEASVLEEQTLDHVLARAQSTKVVVSYEELIAGLPLPEPEPEPLPEPEVEESREPAEESTLEAEADAEEQVAAEGSPAPDEEAPANAEAEKGGIASRIRRFFGGAKRAE